MSEIFDTCLFFLGTVLPILNPLAVTPVYLAMTQGASSQTRAMLAKKLGFNVFGMILVTSLLGNLILRILSISLPIVQIGGGLLVVAGAWKLLNEENPDDSANVDLTQNWTPEKAKSRAFFPLSFPIVCGPGTLAAGLTVTSRFSDAPLTMMASGAIGVGLACAVIGFVVFLCTRYAAWLMYKLGDAGGIVLMKLAAFILLCIGVQIIWGGMQNLAPNLFN